MPRKTPATPLIDRVRGSDFLSTFAPKYRSGLLTVTTKIPGVDNAVLEDALDGAIIQSQVVTNRDNEREKSTTTLEAGIGYKPELVYNDQEFDRQLGVVFPVQRYLTVRGAEYGLPHRRIEGQNPKTDEVENYDLSAIQAVLDGIMISYPVTEDVSWPTVLDDVLILWELGGGEGTSDENGDGTGAAPGTSVNINASTEAHSSKHAVPKAIPHLTHPDGQNIDGTEYYFFMPFNCTKADILGRLGVDAWPRFNPVTRTIFLVGMKVEVSAHAAARFSSSTSSSGSSEATSSGGGKSYDGGPNIEIQTIGPCINGPLDFNDLYGGSVHSTVSAHARVNFGIVDSGSFDPVFDVDGRVQPMSFPPTVGATEVPSGVSLLRRSNCTLYDYQRIAVRAVVLNLP